MARSDWGIGIVGLGNIANVHLEAYRKAGLNIVGGAEVDARKRKLAQERWKLPTVTEDFRELVSMPDVKVVDVAVPQNIEIRRPIIEFAAEQGRALFVQKPMVPYLSQAKELVRIAEQHSVPFMVNQNSLFVPGFMAMEPYLRDPRYIGRPYYFQIENRSWAYPRHKWAATQDRFITSAMGIHHCALVVHWFGEWESVYALQGRDASQSELKGENLSVISVKFESGVQGVIINNWCYRGSRPRPHPREEIVIQGDAGAITGDSEDICVTTCDPPSEIRPKFQGKWFPDAFGNSMCHFLDALDKEKPFLSSGRENLKAVALAEAAYLSAAERREVRREEL
ncbi:MAG: Gfo/Idh/MocA family oxidoreductase [Planctomycetes bacterium]|nr:Gfo/Idh/MocA family oxidoreductase [Planctomycetota bacterium]